MSGTLVVAIYAALVATATAVLQVVTWVLGHRTRIRVEVLKGLIYGGPGEKTETVIVTAINDSAHLVRVASVGIRMQDGSDARLQKPSPLPIDTIPGDLRPHDSGDIHFYADELRGRGIDLAQPIVAVVRTADGKPFESQPTIPGQRSRRRTGPLSRLSSR